jgi:uncharacterized membrane protein YhdT
MDERYEPQPVAAWFKYAATASILFMAIGCWGYIASVRTDVNALPLDERNLMLARPMWMIAAYAIAVWVGLLGSILLFMRRKLAEPLLLVSLVAAVVTFLPYAVVRAVRDLITTNDIAFALVIVAITWTIFWFARHSRQRGWLR